MRQAQANDWVGKQIGGPVESGSLVLSGGTLTLTGGGAGIGGVSDQFYLGSSPATGDLTLTSTLSSLSSKSVSAKAGLMMRESTSPGARYAAIFLTAAKTIRFETRANPDAAAIAVAVDYPSVPVWLRLVKAANRYSAYYSVNGTTWTQVGSSATVRFASAPFEVGLAITAQDNAQIAKAVFSGASYSQSILTSQAPQLPNISDGRPYELGMKFQSSVAGRITGIRHFKAASETGAHIGRIWSAAGAELAKVSFTNETASGWQTAYLASPLNIEAGAIYTVSVNVQSHFPDTYDTFGAVVRNGTLSTVVDNNNGTFGNAGQFPKQSYRNSNYFRDIYFEPSSSAKAAPTVSSLTVTPNPAITGQSVSLTATVTSANVGVPTGSITFIDGVSPVGTAALSGGKATLSVNSLSAGTHPLTAVYGGDASFGGSTSASVALTVNAATVNPAPTTSVLTITPNPAYVGQPVVLTASITSAGAASPTGTFTFKDGATPLGNATINSGKASLTVSSLAVGQHALSGTYSGSASFAASNSSTTVLDVSLAPTTTTLTASPNPAVAGQAVVLSAAVTSPAPGAITGAVVFFDGTANLGTATLSGGKATLSTISLAKGSHSLTASFGAGSTFAGSNSGPISLTINSAPSAITTFAPVSGAPGSLVAIKGTGLTAVSAVAFNSTPASSFSILSDTSMTATVPQGASTGPIQITTAGGVIASAAVFTVTGASPSNDKPATRSDAARFLSQATFGYSIGDVDRLMQIGYGAWIDEQLSKPITHNHTKYSEARAALYTGSYQDFVLPHDVNASQFKIFTQGEDQLRQKMVYALSQILVVSTNHPDYWPVQRIATTYLDMLTANAFGNYRTLLEAVTLSPAMGTYLSYVGNRKEDPIAGTIPDQNFAREVMQLFTIGLFKLNPDGTAMLVNNAPAPTYTSADVIGGSRVMTGWHYANQTPVWNVNYQPWPYKDVQKQQLIPFASYHSTSQKSFLGTTIPASSVADPRGDLKIFLDTLFAHPNVGPFIGKQLIQRFVTSNPSPAYVSRVAAVFGNNGNGVRGDLGAVLRAILLDTEARDNAKITDPTFGRIREPISRLVHLFRMTNAIAPNAGVDLLSDFYIDMDYSNPLRGINQLPLHAPTVFNFYRPDYAPPASTLSRRGLVSPEMQITDESSLYGWQRLLSGWTQDGGLTSCCSDAERNYYSIKLDYSQLLPLVATPDVLLDRLSLLTMSGQMSPELRRIAKAQMDEVYSDRSPSSGIIRGVTQLKLAAALYAIFSSPEYVVQK